MVKFEVKSRITGAVQFTADIKCDESESYSVKMGLAVRWAFKAGANLAGANLAGAYLGGANLEGAYLRGAYLAGAYLAGANLEGAYLRGAYLAGANLEGANLGGLILLARATRKDGYEYFAWTSVLGGMVITAGCRTWQDGSVLTPGKAIEDARNHCTHQTDAAFRKEVLSIVEHIERMAE
jgi:hypothetical protein